MTYHMENTFKIFFFEKIHIDLTQTRPTILPRLPTTHQSNLSASLLQTHNPQSPYLTQFTRINQAYTKPVTH